MMPILWFFLWGAILAISGCAGGEEPSGPGGRPNIVLIMTDDQGWAQVGFHGDEILETPHLDRLAGESVEMTRFYVSPVCSPTRANLMTGRYNYRTGVVDTWLGRSMMYSDEVTLAEMLGGAGYRTGIFGKWHLGDNYPLRAIDQGFQEALVHKGGGIGQPSDPPGNTYFDPVLQHNGKAVQGEGYCTDIFFAAAMDFISQSSGEPFFVYIATNAPHAPFTAPESYAAPYKEKGLNDKDAHIYGMITNIDDNAGRLMARLDELGIAGETILIFMTDNGPTTQLYTAGLRDQKTSVYDGGIRVPFLLRWPDRLTPAKIETIAAHIDVAPTLLDAAGVEKPPAVSFDGRSLLPLIEGRAPQWPERTLFLQSHRGNEPQLYRNFAAVTQQYKLVQPLSFQQPPPPDAPFELYDLEADPGEQNNLAAEMPDVVARLKGEYEAWFEDVSSTRGFAPPRIYFGTPHENPVTLTRQDWRIDGPGGWSDDHPGYWEVEGQSQGEYRVRVRTPAAPASGNVEFRLGDVELSQPVAAGAEEVVFESAALPAGPNRLEAYLKSGGKTIGVRYFDLEKLN